MISLTIAYEVQGFTRTRFDELMRVQEALLARGERWRLTVQPVHTPDSDRGISRQEIADEDWVPPIIALIPTLDGGLLRQGALSCTAFHHRGFESFIKGLTRGGDFPLGVTLERAGEGFRATTLASDWLTNAGGHAAEFAFETDESLDQCWLGPVQDEGFLRRSVPAVFQAVRELMSSQVNRRSSPPLPRLGDGRILGCELAPGLWLSLPCPMQLAFYRDTSPPVLVIDPARYVWREEIEPRRILLVREGFLAADLSVFGKLSEWEGWMERFAHDPAARERVRMAVAGTCVERATRGETAAVEDRWFPWPRYVEH